ncbi:DNA-3-methyladenine glycosylase family protein [Vulgatibacter incomptus]|uniref:DNA-3-methyladenine glycosylase II n=1 Tax=Vulgatibacter incomptus TaxID=1391653 RepID=A0A0K1PG78_9BACT|nr:DNA-3-methyladenine glycosylase [Vulgatibacter incomptus]AKU92538.1 DNA-3-methyladenine glycosylase II [Vulgatibacter incomptus]
MTKASAARPQKSSFHDAESVLRESDPRLGRLIDAVVERAGRQRFPPSPAATHFEALARSIVYQQLSGKAAATIWGRVVGVLGGAVTPEPILSAADETLRAAGLSNSKVRYVRALARAVHDGEVDLDHVESLPDDAVIRTLTAVSGIGVWTAQMFLMFRLHRPDVLATGDLGIQKGLQIAHCLKNPAAPGYVLRAGSRWAPHRSLACLYLWAALDLKVSLTED